MEIASFLFGSNKKMLDNIKERLMNLAQKLVDINKPPGFLFYLSDGSDIINVLKAITILYKQGVKNIGTQSVMEFISRIKPVKYSLLKGLNLSNDTFLIHLVESDIYKFFPKASDFINKDWPNSRVANIIKTIECDEDNLVTVNKDFELKNQHIIYKNKYRIYYHPFLRRKYSGNFTEVIAYLIKVAADKKVKLKIALDPIRVTDSLLDNNIMEFDYWFGPKFNLVRLNDPKFIGLTIHTRSVDDYRNAFSPLCRTEFNITNTKDGKKAIEIEDIVPTKDEEYTLQKYTHILWDPEKNYFFHFDPAIKIYTKEEHQKRLSYEWASKDINNEAKCKKIKMFRIDGPINIELAMGIIADFYRENELIHEFFGDGVIDLSLSQI